jgi:6-phospho-3-hexuloisomerase
MGKGRTGLVVDMFAMRLTHLGLQAFCIGNPTTPRMSPADMLVLASGTGETKSILLAADQARRINAHIAAFSIHKQASLVKIADELIALPQDNEFFKKVSANKVLVGTLFEEALFITFDSIVGIMMDKLGQSYADLSERHANIE